jgi:hypothetical protein
MTDPNFNNDHNEGYQIALPSAIVVAEAPVLAMPVSCIQSIRKAAWRDGVPDVVYEDRWCQPYRDL